ncbi:FmdB family zinc ribbon protein [Candidatus Magnetominusculus dajiuhuensis]|uniref:FmdB family zinc ribbon protein n=1 Tax=Candidatus Magnetominusculus dajiuhuensis TaxID=3137712 RepID=UPI003B42B16A
MPTYEYACMDCKRQFELWQKMGAVAADCPWCSSSNTTKLMSLCSSSSRGDGASAGSGHFGGT